MVASTESMNWLRINNGVDCKFAPPTSPTPQQHNCMALSGSNGLRTTFDPGAKAICAMKNMEHVEKGIFAVPAVPKKMVVLPRRPSIVQTSDSLPAVAKIKKPISEDIIHDSLQRVPSEKEPERAENKFVEDVNQTEQQPTVQPSLTEFPTNTTSPGSEESVSNMLLSIAGILRKRSAERITNVASRFGRLNNFHVTRAVTNTLKGGATMFHDYLNRESARLDAGPSFLSSAAQDGSSRRSSQEDASTISSKPESDRLSSDSSLLSVPTKEEMKAKTSSQLMEFVKRVESNQRREAFEKESRPAYLLNLTKHQSAERAAKYTSVAQHLIRAVDRATNLDPHKTDSSSGGESADEAEAESFRQSVDPDHLIPLEQRGLHRYAVSRHAIGTRYSFAHRQLARMEYSYQVVCNLLLRLQQKQSVAVFSDAVVEENTKSGIKPPVPVLHKEAVPRPWDDREVVSLSKTPHCAAILRFPTAKSTSGASLHPCAGVGRRRLKISAPNFGLNYQTETYEATMWKERLSSGKFATLEDTDEEEDVEEFSDLEESKEKELTDCTTPTSRGCAKARPLIAFRKRSVVSLNCYPPRRRQQEHKNVQCECYSRSMMPDVLGPVSCAVCMGQLGLPNWTERVTLLQSAPEEALSRMDSTYHPHLSQPSCRTLDVLLAGVSMEFDPLKFPNLLEEFNPRITKREKYVALIKRKAELVKAIRRQEEDIRSEKERARRGQEMPENRKKKASKNVNRENSISSKMKPSTPRARPSKAISGNRKRQRLESSETSSSDSDSVDSKSTSRTRSTSVGSTDLSKSTSRRGVTRLNSIASQPGQPRKRRDTTSDLSQFVVPYGMTAPTKIEKIQYKEIVVPKFRDLKAKMENIEVTEVTFIPKRNIDDADSSSEEDLTEEHFVERHIPCEVEERNRFSLPEKNPRRKNQWSKLATDKKPLIEADFKDVDAENNVEGILLPPAEGEQIIQVPTSKKGVKKGTKGKNNGKSRLKRSTIRNVGERPKAPRPRKTQEQINAQYPPRQERPVRTRRSTFRATPEPPEV